jgi:hypothetical protein
MLAFHILKDPEKAWAVKHVRRLTVLSGLFSFALESAQAFLPRSTSILDIITNTSGAVMGYAAAYWLWKHDKHLRLPFFGPCRRAAAGIFYLFLLTGTCLLPYTMNRTKNWDSRFPLLLGNEATLDRRWEGEIALAAIYNTALKPDQAARLYAQGFDSAAHETRRAMDVTVLYDMAAFEKGVIPDIAGDSTPLNLTAVDVIFTDHTVRLSAGSRIRSADAGGKITEAIEAGSAFSVELWIRTASLGQAGPARLISFSENPEKRNFTLGQQGDQIHFRVRTPITGPNGSYIQLKVPCVITDSAWRHIIAVFNRGAARLYVNGAFRPPSLQADLHFLPALLGLGRNGWARAAFCFLAFFPLGYLWAGVFTGAGRMAAPLICGLNNAGIQLFYYYTCGQPFGWTFLLLSACMGISGAAGVWLTAGSDDSYSHQ